LLKEIKERLTTTTHTSKAPEWTVSLSEKRFLFTSAAVNEVVETSIHRVPEKASIYNLFHFFKSKKKETEYIMHVSVK